MVWLFYGTMSSSVPLRSALNYLAETTSISVFWTVPKPNDPAYSFGAMLFLLVNGVICGYNKMRIRINVFPG